MKLFILELKIVVLNLTKLNLEIQNKYFPIEYYVDRCYIYNLFDRDNTFKLEFSHSLKKFLAVSFVKRWVVLILGHV